MEACFHLVTESIIMCFLEETVGVEQASSIYMASK